jgi:hypothetical protein
MNLDGISESAGVGQSGIQQRRSEAPPQPANVVRDETSTNVHGDISVGDLCAAILGSATTEQINDSARIVVDVEGRRGCSLPLDAAVALCILRFYTRLSFESVVALMVSMSDAVHTVQFLERMARDTLCVLPSTPSSNGTVWQHPVPSAFIATPLRTVSRAMRDCTWDLSSTVSVDIIAPADPSVAPPHHRITYHQPLPLVTDDSPSWGSAAHHRALSVTPTGYAVTPSSMPHHPSSMDPRDPTRASSPIASASQHDVSAEQHTTTSPSFVADQSLQDATRHALAPSMSSSAFAAPSHHIPSMGP